jgi:ferrochelatase
MQISSIVDIVGGELLNTPSIAFVYNIKTNPKRINEGDLFIAKNDKDLQLAVDNGAFGIILDFHSVIIDNEIAWIRVDSYENALVRIFRYKLSNLELNVYHCNAIVFEFLNIYKNTNKTIKFISNNLENSINVLENINNNDVIFCVSKVLLDKIYPNNKTFVIETSNVQNLVEHSLFETSFSYKGVYFAKVKLCALYLNAFLSVYDFLNIPLDLTKLKRFDGFKPLFIDRFINTLEFGRSDKFILTQKSQELARIEIDYILNHYKYAKTIFITKEYLVDFAYEQIVISSIKKLKATLKNQKFNCAYIIGYDFAKVEKTLINSNDNFTLL